MKIIVVGCGKVGKSTIESLIKEKHNIVAIDHNPKVIEMVTNTYDVMAVCGLATSMEILTQANVAQADLFVAVTQNDEVNMLACFLARSLGAKHTIARIRESNYNDDGLRFIAKQLNISIALNPEKLTAESLYAFSRLSLDLEGTPFKDLLQPAYLGLMADEDITESAFSRCSQDVEAKIPGGCAMKLHVGPGMLKRGANAGDKEVKLIFDLDVSMNGNIPVNMAAASMQTVHMQAGSIFRDDITDTLHSALDPE